MLKKIDHLGIAVRSLEVSLPIFQGLGLAFVSCEEIPDQRVKVAVLEIGGINLELLEPTDGESTIYNFISKRGEGLHHVAYQVDDIESELKRLKEAGYELLDSVPRLGADNKKIAFLHPKSTNYVLTELCQPSSED